MIYKQIEQIQEKHLQILIDNQVIEGKTIEYKQELPGQTPSEKKEFMADVSSFSNAAGGDLIFGISESNGIPSKLMGIEKSIVDQTILRLEGMIRDGIEPRIQDIIIQPIELANKRIVLIIRIPKSWYGPHRVSYRGHNKFYIRNSNGKHQMDVDELRSAFNLSETRIERIKKFREDRIQQITAGKTPIKLTHDYGRIILHLIPISAFEPAKSYDFKEIPTRKSPIIKLEFFSRRTFFICENRRSSEK